MIARSSPLRFVDLPPVWLVVLMTAVALWGAVYPGARLDAASPLLAEVFDVVGYAVMVGGVALMAWAGWTMMRARTPVLPRKGPRVLVTGGPFQFSRNPIYLGESLVLLGWIMVVGSIVGVVALPIFMGVIRFRFIAAEEEALAEAFAEDFADWRAKVRRWI